MFENNLQEKPGVFNRAAQELSVTMQNWCNEIDKRTLIYFQRHVFIRKISILFIEFRVSFNFILTIIFGVK